MAIKLVALDLDGTVVNEALAVSPAVKAVLNHLEQDLGVKVVLATGRMFPSTLPFARKIGVLNPVISYQGGMIRDIRDPLENPLDHPILFHKTIAMNVAHDIVDYVTAEGLHTNVYVNDNLYTSALNPKSEYYKTIAGVTPQEAKDLHAILTTEPTKMMIIDDRCDTIVQHLRETYPVGVSVLKSRHDFCEIVNPHVSKWQALSQLMVTWGILPEEVMAIGDQENDLSMIEAAGIGVAMGNAPDHVKAQANWVTESIEHDGVLKAVERFVLNAPFAFNETLEA